MEPEASVEEAVHICRQHTMKISEIHAHHAPVTFPFVEIIVKDHMEFSAFFVPVPAADRRSHGVQVGDDELAARLEHPMDLPVVGLKIREVALVQIRHDEIERTVREESQIHRVRHSILFTAGGQLPRGGNHRFA